MRDLNNLRLISLRLPGCDTDALEAVLRQEFPATHRFCESDGEPKLDAIFESWRCASTILAWSRLCYSSMPLIDVRHFYSGTCGFGLHFGLADGSEWKYVAVIADPVHRIANHFAFDRQTHPEVRCYSDWVAFHTSQGRPHYVNNLQCRSLISDGWLSTLRGLDASTYQRLLENVEKGVILIDSGNPRKPVAELGRFLGTEMVMAEVAQNQIPVGFTTEEVTQIRQDNAWDVELYKLARGQAGA